MRPRPLFMIGNKRSGSTLLVNLLNLHPSMFVTHESDILWILWQARNGWPTEFCPHPLDAPRGLESTLETCSQILELNLKTNLEQETLVDTFYEVQMYIMHHGSLMDKPKSKTNLAWVGDKKPVQYCQPEMVAFARELFPDVRYLHMVRDPHKVVASMVRAAETWKFVPDYWTRGPEVILQQWARHERSVESVKESGIPVHTVRLEDLSSHPVETMRGVYQFLDLSMPEGVELRIPEFIDKFPNRKYEEFELPDVYEAQRFIERYGYAIH